jgi:radical SAM protein with 4Fe4S-binding SPASM domain
VVLDTDILRIQHHRGINTIISTNGQNLNDDKVLKALIDYPPTYLIVCLDGISDETNAKFRVGAKLAPALYGVRELARIKRKKHNQFPILHHRFIAMKQNEHEIDELPSFSARNQFDVLSIRTLSFIDKTDDIFFNFQPDTKSLRAYGYVDGKRVRRNDFICDRVFVSPVVLVDGRVIVCEQDYGAQQSCGSLSESTFKDIWFEKRAMEIRKTIRDDMNALDFCQRCPFKDRPVKDCDIIFYDLQKGT